MTLREYLYTNNITIDEFAKMIFFHRDYVSRVMRGMYRPSKRFGFAVEMVTKGKVQYEDLFDKVPEKPVKNLVV
jgi:hypothetical protein